MLESILASLIANMLWDEMKVNKLEKKLEDTINFSLKALNIIELLVKNLFAYGLMCIPVAF